MSVDQLRDPLWRLSNLYTCREEGTGRAIPLRLRPEQHKLLDHLINKPQVPAFVIKSRRLGISTAIGTLQADCAVFSSGFRGMLIDKTQLDATKKMVEILRFAVDNLPAQILDGLVFDKRNDSELRLRHREEVESQDSVVYATTSGRGGDCALLHVSEWGPIAATDPVRSREIRSGAFPAARKGRRVVETTWYGGKAGDLWDLIKPILDGNPNAEGVVYFFPWHADPQAIKLDGLVTAEVEDYFLGLSSRLSKAFSPEQKKWYAAKQFEQGMWIKREYPSTLDEALSVPMPGTIYGAEIDSLREKKRIVSFEPERQCPAYTFWDIGLSDYGAIWLVQFVGRDILLLDYCTATGEPAAFYADAVRAWERLHGLTVRGNYLPHDADTRERSSGKTYRHALEEAGLDHLITVPRTPDIWLGVNELRQLLSRCYVHAVGCARNTIMDEQTLPSGLECLELYHKRVDVNGGAITETPVHDIYSHGASALRTLSEAYRLGMIEGTSYVAKDNRSQAPKVLRGVNDSLYGVSPRRPIVVRR